jgi:hypothetical protein
MIATPPVFVGNASIGVHSTGAPLLFTSIAWWRKTEIADWWLKQGFFSEQPAPLRVAAAS